MVVVCSILPIAEASLSRIQFTSTEYSVQSTVCWYTSSRMHSLQRFTIAVKIERRSERVQRCILSENGTLFRLVYSITIRSSLKSGEKRSRKQEKAESGAFLLPLLPRLLSYLGAGQNQPPSLLSSIQISSNIVVKMSDDDDFDDLIVSEEVLASALANDAVETDEERQARLRKDIDAASNGTELFQCIVDKLPISGQKFGTSLSMNRALVYLKSVKLCDELTPTWANCKKVNKDVVATVFGGVVGGSLIFASLKTSVLEGFAVKRVSAAKIVPKARRFLFWMSRR